jgi:predicted RNA-binding protein YlqC (UPF0109 family)
MVKDLIEYIARSLTDEPEQVKVTQKRAGNRTRIELQVEKQDMGRVIGKGGKVANAMRVLLRVAAARDGAQASLFVVEPEL